MDHPTSCPLASSAPGLAWPGPLLQVPASRAHVLEEPLADLSVFGVDHLIYIPSPGHSPGHISLLHHPSRTLLAVDGVSFIRPSLRRSSPGDANDTRVGGHASGRPGAPPAAACQRPLRSCLVRGAPAGGTAASAMPAGWWFAMQVVWSFKPLPFLPGLTLRAEPHIVCQGPECVAATRRLPPPLPRGLSPAAGTCPALAWGAPHASSWAAAGARPRRRGMRCTPAGVCGWALHMQRCMPHLNRHLRSSRWCAGASGRGLRSRSACWLTRWSTGGCWLRTTWRQQAAEAGRR